MVFFFFSPNDDVKRTRTGEGRLARRGLHARHGSGETRHAIRLVCVLAR